jgi:DNA-binding response OmpR family regulator
MDVSSHTVTTNNVRIPLTLKEFELLRLFLSAPGQAFSREQLLEKVWGTDYIGESRTVDVHIKRIREKTGTSRNWKISTIWGIGYKFEEM